MRLQPNGRDVLSTWQQVYASSGIRSVQESVPERPVAAHEQLSQWFVIDDDETPFGLLSAIDMGDGLVEVGARFWEKRNRTGLILSDWLSELLRTYSAVMVRCYRTNQPVKRLLQRGGFRLVKLEGRLEFYVVTRQTFLGRHKEVGHYG